MRHRYIRFVVKGVIDRNSSRRQGLFHAAGDLEDAKELSSEELAELKMLEKWFKKHLKVPNRFAWNNRPRAAPKAISWFKAEATEHVRRMYAICRMLNSHDIATEVITTGRPGYIAYEDEHQVAAVPFAETKT